RDDHEPRLTTVVLNRVIANVDRESGPILSRDIMARKRHRNKSLSGVFLPQCLRSGSNSARLTVVLRLKRMCCNRTIMRVIPIGEMLQADFDRRCRTKTSVAHQISYIGKSCGNVARLHGKHVLTGWLAQALFQYLDHLHQLYWLVVPNVVELIWS